MIGGVIALLSLLVGWAWAAIIVVVGGLIVSASSDKERNPDFWE